jgi:transcriptional regulator with XRE-family HTH domain
MTVGARLAEERKRLGFSQGDFAQKAGVSISTQKRYEIDEREGGTGYLEGIRKLGVDVTYVLTGRRRGGAGAGIDPDYLAEFGLAVVKFLGLTPSDVSMVASQAGKAVDLEFGGREEAPEIHVAAFEDYFFVHASELLRQKIGALSVPGEVPDQALLAAAIEQVEQAMKQRGKTFSSGKKAHLVAMVYKLSRLSGKAEAAIADDVVSIADQ